MPRPERRAAAQRGLPIQFREQERLRAYALRALEAANFTAIAASMPRLKSGDRAGA
jgi:hypothetical protein